MHTNTTTTTTILNQLSVSSSRPLPETSLPLTHFDLQWLHFHPLHRLLFYHHPCSTAHFISVVVPKLRHSLSLTLTHYFPLSGALLYPLNAAERPVLWYRPGDSVTLTVAECANVSDFHTLSGHQAREADKFYDYVPQLPAPGTEPGWTVIPLLAVQVTVFPGTGICIGITSEHVVGDASSTASFVRAWGLITKYGGDERFLDRPVYDRSLISDLGGLASKRWDHVRMREIDRSRGFSPVPTNRVRATYVLTRDDIKKLKVFVAERRPNLVHLSSFTIASSLVWTCYVKSESTCQKDIDDEEPEYFAFLADARSRYNPPLPQSYFGNCLATGFIVESTHKQLKGDEFELIGELIRKKANDGDEIFRDAEDWMSNYEALSGKRVFGVAESTKFDIYDADYGWGRPTKFESVFIDGDKYSMSLIKSSIEGGLEIGLSLPVNLMDAFAGFYDDGLKK